MCVCVSCVPSSIRWNFIYVCLSSILTFAGAFVFSTHTHNLPYDRYECPRLPIHRYLALMVPFYCYSITIRIIFRTKCRSGMKKRRKKMSSIVFMAFGEKVYNFITHLSNPAIFRDSTEMHERKKKKKVNSKKKVFRRKCG